MFPLFPVGDTSSKIQAQREKVARRRVAKTTLKLLEESMALSFCQGLGPMVVLCGIEAIWEKPMEESRDLPVGMRVGCVKQSHGESMSGR